jgi:DUF1365 family protein
VVSARYDVMIVHVRSEPVRHEVRRRSYLWYVDLDDLPSFPRVVRRLARFEARDHMGDPARPIRANVDALLAEHGIDLRGGTVTMLTNARSLGYVFNPLSLFWCRDVAGSLVCVIAEVHNTYGGRHRYLLHPDKAGRTGTDKDFYVSPFYPAAGRYHMALPEPGEHLDLAIRYQPPAGAPFAATLRGRSAPATPGAVLRRALRQPCPTALTAARIKVQGIKLYLRGLPLTPRVNEASSSSQVLLTKPARGGRR